MRKRQDSCRHSGGSSCPTAISDSVMPHLGWITAPKYFPRQYPVTVLIQIKDGHTRGTKVNHCAGCIASHVASFDSNAINFAQAKPAPLHAVRLGAGGRALGTLRQRPCRHAGRIPASQFSSADVRRLIDGGGGSSCSPLDAPAAVTLSHPALNFPRVGRQLAGGAIACAAYAPPVFLSPFRGRSRCRSPVAAGIRRVRGCGSNACLSHSPSR